MGVYLDPPDVPKEQWLGTHNAGPLMQFATFRYTDLHPDYVPVILVQNDGFTAAAVAYSADEYRRFTRPEDRRAKWLFIVRRADITAEVVGAIGMSLMQG